jgi:hypothetical protein
LWRWQRHRSSQGTAVSAARSVAYQHRTAEIIVLRM